MGLRDFVGLPATPISTRRPVRSSGRTAARGWDPADTGSLFRGWTTSSGSPDEEVRHRAETEVGRARELERSNPWAVRYFTLYLANVFGESGVRLVPRIVDQTVGADGKVRSIPDEDANRRVREGWERWGRHGEPTVDGLTSWVGAQKLLGVSFKRDGESFARLYRGSRFGLHGFRLGLFEAERVPRNLSRDLANGNRLSMGIERDEFNRPLAYWMRRTHPGNNAGRGSLGLDEFERVPASEIIHLFDARRIAQSRGLPALEAGITSLNMLQGYEEAELVASRAAASKMGFIRTETGEEYIGDEGDEISETEIRETLEPGVIGMLAKDQDFVGFDPTHPTGAFASFVKTMLRRFSAVTGASYNAVGNDLEGVNFSSLRSGKLEERDVWRLEQGHFVDVVSERVFANWLPAALLSGDLGLPPDRLEKFSAHRWQGRRWEWIDPLKEAQANDVELRSLSTTLTEIAATKGRELRELLEEVRAERELAAEMGLEELLPYATPTSAIAPEEPEPPEETGDEPEAPPEETGDEPEEAAQ